MAILLGTVVIVLSGDTGLTGDWFIGYLVVFFKSSSSKSTMTVV